MSFEAIHQEIATWDADDLRKLQALISSLRLRQDEPAAAEITTIAPTPVAGSLKGFWMAPDFDEPLGDFSEDRRE